MTECEAPHAYSLRRWLMPQAAIDAPSSPTSKVARVRSRPTLLELSSSVASWPESAIASAEALSNRSKA